MAQMPESPPPDPEIERVLPIRQHSAGKADDVLRGKKPIKNRQNRDSGYFGSIDRKKQFEQPRSRKVSIDETLPEVHYSNSWPRHSRKEQIIKELELSSKDEESNECRDSVTSLSNSKAKRRRRTHKNSCRELRSRYTPFAPPNTPRGSIRSRQSGVSAAPQPTEVVVTVEKSSSLCSFLSGDLFCFLPCLKREKKVRVRNTYTQTEKDCLISDSSEGYNTVSV